MLILRRGFAAAFDLFLVLSYLFSMSFTTSTFDLVSKDSPTLSALDIAFLLLYYGCLDSGCCGAGTIGKRVFGLEVLMREGRPLPLYLSMARTVLKVGLPFLLFKLAADLVFIQPFIGIAAVFAAVLILPISVVVGKGIVGIHDRWIGTYVLMRGSKYLRVPDTGVYLLLTVFTTAVVALSMSAWVRSLGGVKPVSLRSFANAADQSVETAKEILLGKDSEAIQPFVKNVTIMPSIKEFPTDYSTSYTKVPSEIATELRGKRGAALVIVEVSRQGFAQHILRSAVIDRIVSVGLSKLVSETDLPTFIWIALDVKSTFGPVVLHEVNVCILIIRKPAAEPSKLEIKLAEPSANRFVWVGFSMPGFTVAQAPF